MGGLWDCRTSVSQLIYKLASFPSLTNSYSCIHPLIQRQSSLHLNQVYQQPLHIKFTFNTAKLSKTYGTRTTSYYTTPPTTSSYYTTPTTMSPTAFKQQVSQLIAELEKCDDLCQAIRANRRVGSTTEALDLLQHDILSSATSIDSQFKTLRSIIGSRADLGDEVSRSNLNHSIRELQLTVQTRLSEVAYKRRGERDPIEVPGFRKLNERWVKIHFDVSETIESLGLRLKSKVETVTPKPVLKKTSPEPTTRVPRYDESIISNGQLEDFIAHMKNSWEERESRGEIYYVNVFDRAKTQWERPTGAFIKALPARKTVRVQEPAHSYSAMSNNSKGW